MRIVHVVRQFHPMVGGLEDFVLSLATQQRVMGLDARVVTLNRLFTDPGINLPPDEEVAGVPVHRIGFCGNRRLFAAPGVLPQVAAADLVHVHGVDFLGDFLAATTLLHRKPLVLSTHGGFFHTSYAQALKRVIFNTVTKSSLKRFRRVFASSSADFDRFRTICDDRLKLIENGVALHKFADAASRGWVPTLLAIGRFSSNKRLPELIETFDLLTKRVPDCRLHIVGNDYDGILPSLRDRIARSPAAGRIRIHTGADNEAVRRLMNESSFFVSASNYEGFGITLVEAMSAGLSPIVQSIPSFATILDTAEVGRLTDFADPARAADDIADHMDGVRRDYGRARADCVRASARYGWEVVERRFASEYEEVLGVRRRAILGVDLSVLNRAESVHTFDAVLDNGDRLNVAFANANTLNVAARNGEAKEALRHCLILNDGIGVDLASRIKYGRPFAENLNGTDLIPHYLAATRRSLRIYLVGSTDTVVTAAARRFAELFPRHTIVGWRNGFFDGENDIAHTCAAISRARADLVLVGLGNPAQELWIARYGDATGAKLLIGVGALFDFVSGHVTRAPNWMRDISCEWVYRLAREPRRLAGRYLIGNVAFMARVIRDRHKGVST